MTDHNNPLTPGQTRAVVKHLRTFSDSLSLAASAFEDGDFAQGTVRTIDVHGDLQKVLTLVAVSHIAHKVQDEWDELGVDESADEPTVIDVDALLAETQDFLREQGKGEAA